MNSWSKVLVSYFLEERKNRYSAEEANKLGLKRLEKIDFLGTIHLTNKKETRTGMILIKKGDLVISGINVEKGAIAVYTGENDVLATIHYSSYIFDDSKIDIEYFKWFLKSNFFKNLVNSSTRGGIKTEIKPKHFLSIIIPLPSLDLQKEVRKKIDSVKVEIEKLKQLDYVNDDNIQNLKQAILKDAVSGKLVPQDPNDEPASELLKRIKAEKNLLISEKKIKKENSYLPISKKDVPFDLPKGWAWVRLGELCLKVHYGYTASADFEIFDIKLLRITDIQNNSVDWTSVPGCKINSKEIDKYLLEENDILIARTGGTIGKSFIVKKMSVKAVFASYLIRLIPSNFVNPEYLKKYLESDLYWEQLFQKSMGTGQPNVNGVSLSNLKVPLPPFLEQKRIVNRIEQLMKHCSELETKIKENQKNSDLLMDAVLREAFAS